MKDLGLKFSILFILASCSGTFYLDVGQRKSDYFEKPKEGTLDDALSKDTGRTIVVAQGNNQQYETTGKGMQYGFTYASGLAVQKVLLYKIEYDLLDYSYNIDGSAPVPSPLTIKANGIDYTVGFSFWYFLPKVTIKRESVETVSVGGNFVDTWMFFGYGIDLILPITKSINIYAGHDKRFRVTSDPNFSFRNSEFSVGIMINLFGLFSGGGSSGGSSGGGGQNKSGPTFGNPFFDL